MKRTERHHLKENEMQEGFSWFVDFYEDYKREILVGGIVLACAVVVFAALFLIRSHTQGIRNRAVGEVVSLAQDLEAKPGNLGRLETLASGGPAARLACLELAGYWAGKGDAAKADSYLGRIPAAPKDDLYYQAEDLKAQLLVKKKEYDKAIAVYQKMREEKPTSYPLDAVLFHLAEAYELKGQTKEALDLYTTLQSEYTQTYFGYEASMKAARLGLRK